ncbi:broad specificity phosphatase PhoE [Paucibacter oligotrophus]|uniref:Broad specificity phosphatase PhoE n=2 Tax=Roseateles oligotrophus TaxID=1769250 RepID=A0A840LGL2_9BURK|nr:broad specificity phosphatase PhoE [Roseateles oligotrophus]
MPGAMMAGMGTLYLVRHGQASLGAEDYDQLSELGRRQCLALGRYWRERGLGFDAVLSGTLKRHQQSLIALSQGLQQADLPAALACPGLDEYDSEALIRAVHAGPLQRPQTPEAARAHFRLLREGLAAWMAGRSRPQGMASYADFSAGVAEVLRQLQQRVGEQAQARVLLVSSGGPISTAIGQVLGTPADATIELNLRLRNSAVSEFAFSARRMALQTFNSLAHLDDKAMHSFA